MIPSTPMERHDCRRNRVDLSLLRQEIDSSCCLSCLFERFRRGSSREDQTINAWIAFASAKRLKPVRSRESTRSQNLKEPGCRAERLQPAGSREMTPEGES